LLVVRSDFGGRVKIEGVVLCTEFALGNRPIVGVKHDADYLAFVGRASGRRAGGSSREQLGQQWVFLSHGLVGNDCDLTITWRGHEGDDTATLEKAENTLAHTAHESLDLVLRGRGRRMEHLTLSVAVCVVHTVEENSV